MVRLLAVTVVVFAGGSWAQNGALSVSCADCGAFQGLQLYLDGVDMGMTQRIVEIGPGDHEVKVVKWKSPFSTEVLYSGVLGFPRGTELRAKASKGKLEVYGKGPYTPAAPVVTGPNEQQRADAIAWLDEAKESVDELQERIEGSDDECVGRLAGRLGSLEDAINDARRTPRRDWADAALSKAIEAQKVLGSRCGERNVRKWGKPMDRVVSRLQSASRSL